MSNKLGKTYINSYLKIDAVPAVEKIFIDEINPELTSKVKKIWNRIEPELNRINDLEKIGSKISNVFHRTLPFKGFNSTDQFFKELGNVDLLAFSNRYLLQSFASESKKLSELVETNDINCVGHSIILDTISSPEWEVYNQTYTTKNGAILKDAHCVIAKRFKSQVLIIDPSNGPLKERKNRKVYSLEIKKFNSNYKLSTFITE